MRLSAAAGVGALVRKAITASEFSPERRERYRPVYHFTPQKNWMNDPNGLVYFRGKYHLFCQYNPFGDRWGHMSWGHATSDDMVSWERLPVALVEHDGKMFFSGSVVVDARNSSGLGKRDIPPLVAVYTANLQDNQRQEIAFSRDGGTTWEEYSGNSVIDIHNPDFRDPKVFWHEATRKWVMVVSLAKDKKVRIYGSEDLIHWSMLSEFGPAGALGSPNWECPNLFPLSAENQPNQTRWVLKIDLGNGAFARGSGAEYFEGEFDGEKFRSEQAGELWVDYGKDFYAAQVWSDLQAWGRTVWLGWMNNWWYAQDVPTSPWRGAMTVPRQLTLRSSTEGWRLIQAPFR
jgi:fructan beta-fructosidase